VQRLYWSKNILKGAPFTNGSGYSNAQMDRILEAAQVEPDPQKRRKLWEEFQQLAMALSSSHGGPPPAAWYPDRRAFSFQRFP
jgi:ABC-type transport system substrate-binding protein